MVDSSITNSKYIYVHENDGSSEAVDIHHIIVRNNGAKGFLVYFFVLLILANTLYLFLAKVNSIAIFFWSFLLDALLVMLLILHKPVKKESVVVMPAFGVQLESHYVSGKVIRHFVPIDKILKPVLLECVTPVTCYWNLSLLVRGEELMLVFKGLRPPAKILVPIWKALCAATDTESKKVQMRLQEMTNEMMDFEPKDTDAPRGMLASFS